MTEENEKKELSEEWFCGLTNVGGGYSNRPWGQTAESGCKASHLIYEHG